MSVCGRGVSFWFGDGYYQGLFPSRVVDPKLDGHFDDAIEFVRLTSVGPFENLVA
jgi:hypothetical protein